MANLNVGDRVYVTCEDGSELQGTIRKVMRVNAVVDVILNECGEIYSGAVINQCFLKSVKWGAK